jgi:hypothetical protein
MSRKLTKEEIVERAKNVHKDKYDYTDLVYKDMSTNINVKCKIHGEFFQRPFDHLKGLGCSKCGVIKSGLTRTLTNNEFIEKANKIHNNKYKYPNAIYLSANKKLLITCENHGDFEQTPNNHISKKHGCPNCSKLKKLNSELFRDRSIKIYKDKYDYSFSDYINNKTEILPSIITNKHICVDCGKEIDKKSVRCIKCNSKKRKDETIRRIPNKETLLNDIKEFGYCGTGRKYNVSDNTIRKWLKILDEK